MEILPNDDEKSNWPKGKPHCWRTIQNFKIKHFEKELKNKLPNEFRSALTGYNHRNDRALEADFDISEFKLL